MDYQHDYYAILGILPSAEGVVIKAAYKALSQRYHPDKYTGPEDEANEKMKLLNEAYSVLSDSIKRKEYDGNRSTKTTSEDDYFGEESEPDYDPLAKEWEFALKYYPELANQEKRLSKISWKLAYSYRAYLLEEKSFEHFIAVADALEFEFLKIYFGLNPEIIKFAKELISIPHKKAAKELNIAVNILGSNIESSKIINRIRKEFKILSPAQKAEKLRHEEAKRQQEVRRKEEVLRKQNIKRKEENRKSEEGNRIRKKVLRNVEIKRREDAARKKYGTKSLWNESSTNGAVKGCLIAIATPFIFMYIMYLVLLLIF